jgi:hypothetical protein
MLVGLNTGLVATEGVGPADLLSSVLAAATRTASEAVEQSQGQTVSSGVTSYDFGDEPGLVVSAKSLVKKPAAKKKASSNKILGLPKSVAFSLGGMLVLVIGYLLTQKKTSTSSGIRRAVSNPGNPEDIEKASQFSEDFHWGIPAKKVARRKVSPPPKVGVKLGELVAVTYRTRKRGESATDFYHEFGKPGKKPQLVMDARSKRLHIVGGGYTVTSRGIER